MRNLAYLLMSGVLLCASSSSAQQAAAPPIPPAQASRATQPPQRMRFAPQFVPGQVLRYQMEFRTTTESRRTGLVEDPQAPSQLEMTWSAVVRLEVLGVATDASGRAATSTGAGEGGRMRLRTTYEKSVATSRSDTYDPAGAALEEQYRKLEGRTLQYVLDAEGKVSDVEGLQEIVADEKAASAARDWLAQLAVSTSLPQGGIVPGQKWSSEQPATSAPLAGLLWRTESTYLRDEPCRPIAAAGAASEAGLPSGESCAVILTRFVMRDGRARGDPTPDEYRRRGLRTAGTWSGSGESLAYISLRSGWVVSLTQTGSEEMDVTVSTADGQSSVRYAGRVRSQSQVTLLSESPAAVR